ncbi:hypothetical protein LOCC1_G002345 [Lachnellula occidentalis]|uniref:Uncharacterized protein n=1 Tax=Lachnellula occidentalis TaxID=215460 RepID=A0A8H8S6F9_9HELO|nr:hypothetical protein LOCC1_G002345 [Lachnellula occidentalis]
MSAFSRGCFLRHQCAFGARAFQPPRTSCQTRFFSYAPILRAAKGPKRVVPKAKPSYEPAKATATAPPPTRVYQSYANMLAQKLHPTLLYEAPSSTMFMVTSYGAALILMACGGYAIFAFYEPRDDLPVYVNYAFAVIGIVTGGMASYFVLGPSMMIKSISAIPRNVTRILGTPATGRSIPELQLEVELKRMLPFLPAKKIHIKPQELVLPVPLGPTAAQRLTPAEVRQKRAENELRRQQELEYERSHLMTLPFRQMNKAFFSFFQNTRRALVREGFLKVEVKQSTYKLDITGGWALDDGKALDRLVGVKK